MLEAADFRYSTLTLGSSNPLMDIVAAKRMTDNANNRCLPILALIDFMTIQRFLENL